MIFNNDFEVKHAKVDLTELPFEFYLGGSRRMNQKFPDQIAITSNTDYDYYATYTEEIEQTLLSRGWIYTSSSTGYFDDQAVKILWKDSHQVVLRKDAKFYNQVFESIPVKFYYDYLWKKNPEVDRSKIKGYFNYLYMFARNLKEHT